MATIFLGNPKILTVLVNVWILADDVAFSVRKFSTCDSLVQTVPQLCNIDPLDLVGHRESVDCRHVSFSRVLSEFELHFKLQKLLHTGNSLT